MDRDGWRCTSCGRVVTVTAEVHHRVPLEEDGAPYDLDNLATLCRDCHHAAHGKRPETKQAAEWGQFVAELQDC